MGSPDAVLADALTHSAQVIIQTVVGEWGQEPEEQPMKLNHASPLLLRARGSRAVRNTKAQAWKESEIRNQKGRGREGFHVLAEPVSLPAQC